MCSVLPYLRLFFNFRIDIGIIFTWPRDISFSAFSIIRQVLDLRTQMFLAVAMISLHTEYSTEYSNTNIKHNIQLSENATFSIFKLNVILRGKNH